MMTGVYPDRSGIPSNGFIDFSVAEPEERSLDLPEELTANTLFTWIDRKCTGELDLPTAATLSKRYLHAIFAGDAADAERPNDDPAVDNVAPDSHWDPTSSPAYIPDPDEHTPDLFTMQQALSQLPAADFHFINLGDVDRSAHAGGELPRQLVLTATDLQVGELVAALQGAGRWDRTVLFLVSDHGMDYTLPGPLDAVSTQATLDALGACFTPMQAVAQGGTESIYVMDRALPLASRQAALRAARSCILGTADCSTLCAGATRPAGADAIEAGWYTAFDALDVPGNMPASLASMHPNLGDLVLVAGAGAKFGEPDVTSPGAQIPGNHGHPATLRNTFIVAGGSPWVKRAQVVAASAPAADLDRLPEQSENVDIAPTVAWLLGLSLEGSEFPDGIGFDGRVLREAFTQFDADPAAASPTACGRFD